jgi:hypothetical protein
MAFSICHVLDGGRRQDVDRGGQTVTCSLAGRVGPRRARSLDSVRRAGHQIMLVLHGIYVDGQRLGSTAMQQWPDDVALDAVVVMPC